MYRKQAWKDYSEEDVKKVYDFAEDYKDFLSFSKTERLATKKSVELLEQAGFVNGDKVSSLKAGDKVYFVNRNKNVTAYVIGKKPLVEGMRVLGAHIDSPRLDFKEHPIYEKSGFALGDLHYYGGIKKYQWTTIPLAIHGIICRKDGTSIEVHIGEDENDPIIGITDLLIHLSAEQMGKTLSKAIEGENLDITLGSRPLKGEEKEPVKAYVLDYLKSRFQIEEEDLLSAELEVVPAGKSRDYGLDGSMIAGYGHDDRCCAYASLRALLDSKDPEYTSCCTLVDKEEIGSVGATGASSVFFENNVIKLAELLNEEKPVITQKRCFEHSKMLSSDVSAGYDPLYAYAFDPNNSAYFGQGMVINKYTGRGGKSGSNDANPEFYAWVRNALDSASVHWQNAILGRIDLGGGGTIAGILGDQNMDVIDAGIPVLNMHAPMEVISKADLYETYKGYLAFLKR